MVDESSNAEAAHLWKTLSEDEVEVECSQFHFLRCQINLSAQSLIEVIDEFGKLVHPSNCEVPLMDLVVIIFEKLLLLLAETLKMTSGGQVCLQLLGVG
jgi:hypothetical protein